MTPGPFVVVSLGLLWLTFTLTLGRKREAVACAVFVVVVIALDQLAGETLRPWIRPAYLTFGLVWFIRSIGLAWALRMQQVNRLQDYIEELRAAEIPGAFGKEHTTTRGPAR